MPTKFHQFRSSLTASFLALLVLALAIAPALAADAAPVFLHAWGLTGTADGKFFFPYGIDAAGGKVYVADTDNDRVQVFNSDGTTPVSSTPDLLNAPHGVAADTSGNIYVADTGANRLVKLSPDFTVLWSVGNAAGSGFGTQASQVQMRRPYDVAVDPGGFIYVADTYNHRILQFNLSGAPLAAWGGPASGSDSTHFYLPSGVAVDADGFVYIADTYNHRVVKLNSSGVRQTSWGGSGSANGQFNQPRGVAAARGYVYVADTGNQRIQKFSSQGVFSAKWGSSGTGTSQFNNPYAVAAPAADTIYVADTFNDRVQVFEPDTAPTALSLSKTEVTESQPLNTLVGTLSATDGNTGENSSLFVYSLVSINGQDCSGNSSFTVSGSELRTNKIFDFETKTSYAICLRVTDTGGLFYDQPFTITIIDGSDAPVINDSSFTLMENSIANTIVGPLTAVDNDLNEKLTFTIQGGSTPEAFSITKIDDKSASLRVADPSLLNFEAYPTHAITVGILVTDALGLTDTAMFTIYLQDGNDAPRLEPIGAPYSVEENAPLNTYIGHVNVIDEDLPNQTVTITKDSGWFNVSNTGDIRANTGINYEGVTGGFVNLKITANDGKVSTFVTVRVNILDQNEQLTLNGSVGIPENSPAGTMINPGNDPEKARLRYTILEDNSGGAFEVVEPHGDLVVKDSSKLDYEALPATTKYYRLRIRVTDNVNPPVENYTNININNINEAPVPNPKDLSINENNPVGAQVGTVTAKDPENNPITFSTTDTTGPFSISTTGIITVKNAAALNYETMPSYDMPVTVKDNGNLGNTHTYTIAINNVNEPITVNNQTFNAAEASPNGTSLGTVVWTDEDANTRPTFITTGGTGRTNFGVNTETGEVTVINNSGLNNSQTRSFTLVLLVADNGTPGSSATPTITIQLTDSNDPPEFTAKSFTIPENSASATVVGTVQATDPNPGDNITYSITGGTGAAAFAIGSTSGQITVTDPTLLNYETAEGRKLTLAVQATDDGDPVLSNTYTFDINLTNRNEAPVLADLETDVIENTPNGATVAQLDITDVDAGTVLTFTVPSGDPTGVFTIDSTGKLKVADVSKLNFEAPEPVNDTFTLAVHVVDNGDPQLSDDATVILHLKDANDPPKVTFTPPSLSMVEHSPNGTAVTTASATDDDPGHTFTFSITGGDPNGAFAINPTTGAVTIGNKDKLDFDTTPVFNLTITATDNGSQPAAGSAVMMVNLSGINEKPVIANKTITVVETTPNGTLVDTVTAADPDAGNVVSYRITGGTGAGAFNIHSNNGQITVKDSTQLIYALHPSLSLVVRATDNTPEALWAEATITVNLLQMADPAVSAFTVRTPVISETQDVFTLDIKNNGGGATGDYTVYVTLPAGITYNPTGTAPECSPSSAQRVVCRGSGLSGSSTKTFTIGANIGSLGDAELIANALLTTEGSDFTPDNNTFNLLVKVVKTLTYISFAYDTNDLPDWYNATGGGMAPLSAANLTSTPVGGRRFLGRFDEDISILYNPKNLPPHSIVEVSFDLYLTGSWDGSHSLVKPDIWKFRVGDSAPLLSASFSNWLNELNYPQSYPDPVDSGKLHAALSEAEEINTMGYKMNNSDILMDSVYRLTFKFDHNSPELKLFFEGLNLSVLSDEGWGIDNLTVKLTSGQSATYFLPMVVRR